jgi:hypothetical protein
MKDKLDPLLRTILVGDDEQVPGSVGGEHSDDTPHPIQILVHQAEFGIAPPAVAPARKTLTIDEIERRLAQRRLGRRKTLLETHPTFGADARAQIRAALLQDRDAVVATGGDLGKLLGQ